jgi:hypothetical protein
MSMEKIVRRIGESLDRRSFLGKLGFGLAASLLGLFTLPEKAQGLVSYACCTLCKSNSGSCSGCACTWCWTCGPWGPRGDYYSCCECHGDSSYCGAGCSNVTCSYVRVLGH